MQTPIFTRTFLSAALCFCAVTLALEPCAAKAKADDSTSYLPPESAPSAAYSSQLQESSDGAQVFDESTRYQRRRDQRLHSMAYDNLPDTDKLSETGNIDATPFVASPRYALQPAPVQPLPVPQAPAVAQPSYVTIPPAAPSDKNVQAQASIPAAPINTVVINSPPAKTSIVQASVTADTQPIPPQAPPLATEPKPAAHGFLARLFSKSSAPSPTPVAAPAADKFAALTPQQQAAAAQNEKALSQLSPAAGASPPFTASPDAAMGPSVTPAPLMPAPAPSPATLAAGGSVTDGKLSKDSKAIAEALPAQVTPSATAKPMVSVEHFRKSALDSEAEVKQHEGVGIKISVRRQKANVTQMLENAYDALIAGNQEEAISLYKEVLTEQPDNRLALFGLATTYHRAGQLQLARPLYGKLLAIDPNNKEGLNNFLVLLSDESPSEALVELDKLEKNHPGFSPVPAQMALIYQKNGNYAKAIEMMNKAIEMSPANLKYRYDMAIMLDKQGAWKDAATLYQQLILASERGEKIPAGVEEIQERLTFIRSNRPKA